MSHATKFDASLFEPEQEMCVAAQAIEFRDDELSPENAAGLQRSSKLRTIAALTAFDLGEHRHQSG
jgi:hypothetical protein